MKTYLKKIFNYVSKKVLSIFYDKNYMQGRWFDDNIQGVMWCWKALIPQKLFRKNAKAKWPISKNIIVGNPSNIYFDPRDLNNFQHYGCYYQNYRAKIFLGRGSYIAPNVGIITENHQLLNLDEHSEAKDVIIGENCWIGMNSIILPGVNLGPNTIVGAGTVVTKSFLEGNCVIVGNPGSVKKVLNEAEDNL